MEKIDKEAKTNEIQCTIVITAKKETKKGLVEKVIGILRSALLGGQEKLFERKIQADSWLPR